MQAISPDDLALVPQAGEQLAEVGVDVDHGQELVFSTEVVGGCRCGRTVCCRTSTSRARHWSTSNGPAARGGAA